MSGRPKRAPASPEEEREQLRQLTRELHEAAQEARDAAKELRSERLRLADGVGEHIGQLVNEQLCHLEKLITDNREVVDQVMTNTADKLREVYAELLGLNDVGKVTAYMTGQFISTILTDEFLSRLGQFVAREAFGAPGPAVMKHGAEIRAAGGGAIRVATREQLDAFVAGGGDPGFVIDGTRF